MIYRRKVIEVDAVPLPPNDEGRFNYAYRVLAEGQYGETQLMTNELFEEQFEEGQANRLTEEHLQAMVRGMVLLGKLLNGGIEITGHNRGRPAYKEGFQDLQQAIKSSQVFTLLMAEVDKIKAEYPEWDQRYFAGR